MKLLKYMMRWQFSTPILWCVVSYLGASLFATVIANIIGALIFYNVDRWIFTDK